MNGPFFFICGQGKVDGKTAEKCRKIAAKHDAEFTSVKMPEGTRYWFSCKNMGFPCDRATANAVSADLDAAKIELPGRPLLR